MSTQFSGQQQLETKPTGRFDRADVIFPEEHAKPSFRQRILCSRFLRSIFECFKMSSRWDCHGLSIVVPLFLWSPTRHDHLLVADCGYKNNYDWTNAGCEVRMPAARCNSVVSRLAVKNLKHSTIELLEEGGMCPLWHPSGKGCVKLWLLP